MFNYTTNLDEIQNLRNQLYANGFWTVPVRTGTKSPAEIGWTTPRPPGPVNPESLNTGILCNGLRIVDIDCDDAQDAKAIQAVAKRILGLTATRTRSGSSRVLLLFRAAEGEPGKRRIEGEGHTKDHSRAVEILGKGQQFVAFGIHPKGSEYSWTVPPGEMVGRGDLPAVTEEQISDFLREAREIIGAKGEQRSSSSSDGNIPDQDSLRAPSLDVARDLVAAIPNQTHGDRTSWIACMSAILGAVGIENRREGEELALDWCARFTGTNDEAENIRVIESIQAPYRVGWQRLLQHAEREGVDVSHWRNLEACNRFEGEDRPATADSQPRRNRYAGINAKDFSVYTAPALVADLIHEKTLVTLLGPTGLGKTAVLIHLMCCIAHGIPFFGKKTLKRAVVLVEMEGARSVQNRIIAWHQHYGLNISDAPIRLIPEDYSFASGTDTADLIAALKDFERDAATPLGLVAIDTLHAASAGLDENNAGDVGTVLIKLREIKDKAGCAALVVHHTGLGDTTRGRGSSSLKGGLDTELLLEKTDSGISLRPSKQKDLDTTQTFHCALKGYEVGRGAEGERITAPVIVATPAPQRGSDAALRGHAADADQVLCDLAKGGKAIKREVWFAAFEGQYAGTASADGCRRIFNKAVQALKDRGRIIIENGLVRISRAEPPRHGAGPDASWAQLLDDQMAVQ